MNSNYDKLVHGEYCFELPSVILSLVPSLFWKVKWSEFRGALHIVTKHFSWKLDTLEGKSLCYVIFYNDPAYISKIIFQWTSPLTLRYVKISLWRNTYMDIRDCHSTFIFSSNIQFCRSTGINRSRLEVI